VGPYGIFVWQLIARLTGQCKPIIWNEIGLSDGLCMVAYRLLWASLSVSARGRTFIGLAAILLAQNNVGLSGIFMWQLMGLIGQCKPIIQNEIGLCKGLQTITYGLLWAILSLSAEALCPHFGPN